MVERATDYDIYCNYLNYLQRSMIFQAKFAVADGKAIHENRFTFYEHGLRLEAAGGTPVLWGNHWLFDNVWVDNSNVWNMDGAANRLIPVINNTPSPVPLFYI